MAQTVSFQEEHSLGCGSHFRDLSSLEIGHPWKLFGLYRLNTFYTCKGFIYQYLFVQRLSKYVMWLNVI